MSQVVVTEDSYRKARAASYVQEQKILTEAEFKPWQKSDVTKMYGILRAVFTPVLVPIFLFWGLLMAGLGLAVVLVARVMQLLGKIFGGSRKL